MIITQLLHDVFHSFECYGKDLGLYILHTGIQQTLNITCFVLYLIKLSQLSKFDQLIKFDQRFYRFLVVVYIPCHNKSHFQTIIARKHIRITNLLF